MAKPTDSELFATDATFAADGDAWSGDAVRVDPGASRRAEGFEPDLLPAEWINHVLGVHGDHLGYIHDVLEGTDTTPAATRTLCLSATHLQPSVVTSLNWTEGPSAGAWLSAASTTNHWVSLHLNSVLPQGAIVTRVRAIVLPGAARATQADRMFLEIDRIDYDFGASTDSRTIVFSGTPSWDDGTATQQTISTGTISVTLDDKATEAHRLQVYSGATAAQDEVIGVEIQYTDPGPRNF
jgi:hypothetical protein